MEINKNIEDQIVETLQNMNNSLYALTATEVEETLDYFTNALNNRLKYEQELFYQSESISGGANPADENDTYDIKNIINRYYYNIQGSHIKLFIDTYISAIDNDDITETVDIIKNIENIYRYVLSIYPENEYDFLYTKQFLDMKSLPTPMETDVLVKEETSRPTPMETDVLVEDLPISSTPTSTPTPMDIYDPTHSSAFRTPPKSTKPLKEIYTSNTLNKLNSLNKKFKSASTKNSIKSLKQKNTINNENKENKTAKRKRETSSEGNTASDSSRETARETAIKKARRSLFPRGIEVGGSKKRTRKYKKYNKIKKTQQNRKKTRKNKTLKKRKEKRNYRTRRN